LPSCLPTPVAGLGLGSPVAHATAGTLLLPAQHPAAAQGAHTAAGVHHWWQAIKVTPTRHITALAAVVNTGSSKSRPPRSLSQAAIVMLANIQVPQVHSECCDDAPLLARQLHGGHRVADQVPGN